jgi:hypothetical protein
MVPAPSALFEHHRGCDQRHLLRREPEDHGALGHFAATDDMRAAPIVEPSLSLS